ncbi:MAG: hypothetical protein ABUT20_33240 [Bacteroidota bacterium]
MKRISFSLFIFVILFVSCTKNVDNGGTENNPAIITPWKDNVMGAVYNAATNTVAYGRADANGYYKIYLNNLDGTNEQALTFPGWQADRHQWPEEWDPTGQYLFCNVEKNDYAPESGHTRSSVDATPGYGAYTDVWVIKRDGSQAWKIVDLPNNYNSAVTHCAISADGKLFAWTERTQPPVFLDPNLSAGAYVFRVATVSYTPAPSLSDIKTYQPGNVAQGGELESISPDKTSLLIYSTFESKNIIATPIYKVDLQTGAATKLTTESFSQCPTYTPDGRHIVFMTGRDCDIFPLSVQGADWWIMNADGSDQRRLTYMNQKDHPQSVNKYRLAGSLNFISDTTFLGGVMVNPLGLQGNTVKVNFSQFVK